MGNFGGSQVENSFQISTWLSSKRTCSIQALQSETFAFVSTNKSLHCLSWSKRPLCATTKRPMSRSKPENFNRPFRSWISNKTVIFLSFAFTTGYGFSWIYLKYSNVSSTAIVYLFLCYGSNQFSSRIILFRQFANFFKFNTQTM